MTTDHWKDVDTLDGARRWLTRTSVSERQTGGVWLAGQRVLAEYDAQHAVLTGIRDQLGEAIHTAFRKGADSYRARRIWEEIDALPAEEWGYVLDFIADSLGLPRQCVRESVTPTDDGHMIVDCSVHGEVARVHTGGTVNEVADGEFEVVEQAWTQHLSEARS